MEYWQFLTKQYDFQDYLINIINSYVGFPILALISYLIDIKIFRFLFGETDFYIITRLAIICVISSFILWMIARHIPKFKSDEIGIFIALTKPENEERVNVNKELRMVYNSLKQLIGREKIGDKVKIFILPDRLAPKNEKEAHALRDKYSGDLIIWGNVEYGNKNNKSQTAFVPIFFSYKLFFTPEDTRKFSNNLSQILSKHKWVINDGDNLLDRSYLVQNLESFSLYIIGYVYYGRDIDISKDFLKRSLQIFAQKTDDEFKIAKTNIMFSLENIFFYKIGRLELWPTSKKVDLEIRKAEEIIKELGELKLNKSYFNLKSILHCVKGEYDLAREQLDMVSQFEQKRDPTIFYNKSYTFYMEGNFIEGTKFLSSALHTNFSILAKQSPNLARWFEDELGKDASKIYLNFPLGVIYNDLMKDKFLAKECLEKSLMWILSKISVSSTKSEKRWFNYIKYQSERRLKKLK